MKNKEQRWGIFITLGRIMVINLKETWDRAEVIKTIWIFFFFFFFFFVFLGLCPQHMEVPRLAVESKL